MLDKPLKLTAILAAISMLAACGGGGGDDPQTNGTAATSGPTFGDCFTLTPGTRYKMTNGDELLIVQESFNGQTVPGTRSLYADGTTQYTEYMKVDNSYVTLVGFYQPHGTAPYELTRIYDGWHFPANFSPSQTISLNYTTTETTISYLATPPTTTTSTSTNTAYQLTFLGFGSLTVANRTFSNTCKIKIVDGGQTLIRWVAKGFGVIGMEEQDSQGVAVPGSHIELASIIAPP